jgi:hypothetical protein
MYYVRQFIFLFGGVLLIFGTLYNPINFIIEKKSTHALTKATIVKVDKEISHGRKIWKKSSQYKATYSFSINNQIFTKTDKQFLSDDELKIGNPIDIIYEKSNPENSHLLVYLGQPLPPTLIFLAIGLYWLYLFYENLKLRLEENRRVY